MIMEMGKKTTWKKCVCVYVCVFSLDGRGVKLEVVLDVPVIST